MNGIHWCLEELFIVLIKRLGSMSTHALQSIFCLHSMIGQLLLPSQEGKAGLWGFCQLVKEETLLQCNNTNLLGERKSKKVPQHCILFMMSSIRQKCFGRRSRNEFSSRSSWWWSAAACSIVQSILQLLLASVLIATTGNLLKMWEGLKWVSR